MSFLFQAWITLAKRFHQKWLKPPLFLATVSLWLLLSQVGAQFLDTMLIMKLHQPETHRNCPPRMCGTGPPLSPTSLVEERPPPPPPPGYFTPQQGACPGPLQRASSLYSMVGIKPSTDYSCGQLDSSQRRKASLGQDQIKPSRSWRALWTLQAIRQIALCAGFTSLPHATSTYQEPCWL